MFLQQYSNGGDFNGCPPEDQLMPGKDGSTCSLECYYCHEWGHISNNCPQIPPGCVRGGGGGRDGGAQTGEIYGTGLLQIYIFFAQNTDEMIPSSWTLLDTCTTSNVCKKEEMIGNIHDYTSDETLRVYTNGGSNNFT